LTLGNPSSSVEPDAARVSAHLEFRMQELSRRTFLAGVGGSIATAWFAVEARDLFAAAAHAAIAGAQQPRAAFQVLTPDQAADIDAFTAQIIPTDETPGAREAHAVYFVDRALATFASDFRPKFEKGWADLRARSKRLGRGAKSFVALTSAQQIAVITAMEKDKSEFFQAMRWATIAGVLANPEYGGNSNKLGWKMIGFDDRFSWASPFGWYDRDVR
jgi:gluconate 2-dehydrogenase gamma chain